MKVVPSYDKCVSRYILLYFAFINEIIQWEEIMEAWYRKKFFCWATLSVSLSLCLYVFCLFVSLFVFLSFLSFLLFLLFLSFLSFLPFCHFCYFCYFCHFFWGGEGRGGELKCYRHTDIQTDPPTKLVLEEHSLLKNNEVILFTRLLCVVS